MTLKKFWCSYLFIVLISSFLSLQVQAQKTVFKNLSWKYINDVKVTQGDKKNILWFDGAMADETSQLPVYVERFDMPGSASHSSLIRASSLPRINPI